MKKFIQKYWHACFGLYIFIYLPWFFYLEKTVTTDFYDMHCALDDLIPFNEYFIIPYLMWFAYVLSACVFMFFTADRKEFIRFAMMLITGMSISLLICQLFPNGTHLRPETFRNNNIFTRQVIALYATDTSTNVFPSIHCYNSMAVHIALHRSRLLKKFPVVQFASLILCILIMLSTVFLKQHSVLDVLGAILLVLILYPLFYKIRWEKVLKLEEK